MELEPIEMTTCELDQSGRNDIVAHGSRFGPDNKGNVGITLWKDGRTSVSMSTLQFVPAAHAQAVADWMQARLPSAADVAEFVATLEAA